MTNPTWGKALARFWADVHPLPLFETDIYLTGLRASPLLGRPFILPRFNPHLLCIYTNRSQSRSVAYLLFLLTSLVIKS